MTQRRFGLQMSYWRRIVVMGAIVMSGGFIGVATGEDFAPEPPTSAPGNEPSNAPMAAPAMAPNGLFPIPYALGIVAGNWIDQGPGPTTNAQVQNLSPNNEVVGGIHAVVTHPTDPDIMYLGAVNGGVWRTVNATAASPAWTPLTDFDQSLSIGALEMDPGNPMILLAGFGRFSSFGGDPPFQVAGGNLSGLLRTTNGGNTWTPITDPLLVGEHISSVASRGGILLAGANDFFGGGGTGGLFRSINTGAAWTQISGGAGTGLPAGTVDDLGGDPANASRLYVALQGDGVYITVDVGANWTQVSNNDVALNAAMLGSTNTRIVVAADSRIFVLVTSGSTGVVTYIGFSDDQGLNWTQMDVPGTVETPLLGRDELMSMAVDPSDSDMIYVAAISQRGPFDTDFDNIPDTPNSVGATDFQAHMFRGDVTRARGLTGNVSNQWDHLTHATGNALMPNGGTANTSAPHADSREMAFDANGDLIEAGDGGVNRRTNPGNNTGDWFSINGDIQVTELHSVAYDANFDILIGGTQDTGAVEQTGPGSTTWDSVRTFFQADGGKVGVDDSTAGTSIRYFSNQRLGLFTRRTCNPVCTDAFPALTGRNGAQFYTPLEINTFDPTRLLLGTLFGLSESLDQGNTASIVPGAGVTANSDAAMVYGHPNNVELIYIGAGSQVLVRTTAGGNLTATAAAFPGGTVFGVAVDPVDENILYAIDNATVYQTIDGGANWTNITGDLTADGAGTFRAIEYIEDGTTDKIVVGTNLGVHLTVEGSLGNWFQLGTNLPNALVWDLDYDAADDVLVAGTLGRGAWLLANASDVNTPPIAFCADVTVMADDDCLGSVDAGEVDDGSFDPDGDPLTLSLLPASPFDLGDTEVTLTVTDDQGASDSCTAIVTVDDVMPPVMSCSDSLHLFGANCLGFAHVPLDPGLADDNCGPVTLEAFPPTVLCGLTETVTIRATDPSGNFSECEIEVSVDCRDPLSQGYWHRQCMGAGLITPGRNGRGNGPTKILEPDFLKELVPAVDMALQNSVFVFRTCEDGMDAEPPNEPCERALKQYTAMLLNLETVRIHQDCGIDLSATGCTSGTIGDLLGEVAGLINNADSASCKQAAACAGAVNENEGFLLPASTSGSSVNPDNGEGLEVADADLANDDSSDTTLIPQLSFPVTERSGSAIEPVETEVSLPTVDPGNPIFLFEGPAFEARDREAGPGDEIVKDSRQFQEEVDRHIAVLARKDASDENRKTSLEALLTALGGGYTPGKRLEIVTTLLGEVDVALRSLLVKHLEDIRIEAKEMGKDGLVKETERLLEKLEPSQE